MLEFLKGDKAELQDLVDSTAELVEGNYTEESWSVLQEALTNANTVLNNENAMQEEVDEVYTELVKAFVNLRLKPNKDLLSDLINKANGLNSASYTANTWAVVENEVIKAQAVLEDPEASEAEVKAAEKALTKALEGLEPVKAGDTTVSVKTGDTTNMMYPLLGLAIASLGFYGNKKKIK